MTRLALVMGCYTQSTFQRMFSCQGVQDAMNSQGHDPLCRKPNPKAGNRRGRRWHGGPDRRHDGDDTLQAPSLACLTVWQLHVRRYVKNMQAFAFLKEMEKEKGDNL